MFDGGVVRDFVDHSLGLAFELTPDAPRGRSPGRVCRNLNEAEASIKFLRIRYGSPPIRTGRLDTGHRIVETDRIRNRIAGYPGFLANPVSEIRRVVTHPRDIRSR